MVWLSFLHLIILQPVATLSNTYSFLEKEKVYLEELRWSKPTNPHETPLSWSLPHPRQDVENISFCCISFEPKYVFKMWNSTVNNCPKLCISHMRIDCAPQFTYMPILLLKPPGILGIKSQGTCRVHNRIVISDLPIDTVKELEGMWNMKKTLTL